MLDNISQAFTKFNDDPLPLISVFIVILLLGIGSKLSKIIEHLAQISYHARATHEAIDKTVSELENMAAEISSIEGNLSEVKNEYYPSRSIELP